MATKLLTVCNKTLGSAYFVKVLGPLIQRILNDARLRDNEKNKPDDCSDISIDVILSVCTEIFDAISSSLDDIPLCGLLNLFVTDTRHRQLRLTCRDLVADLTKRFPEVREGLILRKHNAKCAYRTRKR